MGEGFQVPRPGGASTSSKEVSTVWAQEGAPDNRLARIRCKGFSLNATNLPFANLPVVLYIDAFNSYGMGNKVR